MADAGSKIEGAEPCLLAELLEMDFEVFFFVLLLFLIFSFEAGRDQRPRSVRSPDPALSYIK